MLPPYAGFCAWWVISTMSRQALELLRELGDRRGEDNALVNLGLAHATLAKTQTAQGLRDCHAVWYC